MSDTNKQDLNSQAVPFFARFLEGQREELSEEQMEAVRGGREYPGQVTEKYPSDDDVDNSGGVTTMKYPSDQEDAGSGFPGFPAGVQELVDKFLGGTVHTDKYPSDQDESG